MYSTDVFVNKIVKFPIQQTEDFFQRIADAVPGMIVVYNIKTGQYLYVNNASRKILDYSPQELITGGYPFISSLVHPHDLPRILKENSQAIKRSNSKKFARQMNQAIVEFEYRMRHKKGHWIWLQTSGSILSRDKSGEVEYVLNISIDITRRKEIERELTKISSHLEETIQKRTRELEQTNYRLKQIVDSLDHAYYEFDNKLRYVYINKKGTDFMKSSGENLIGKRALDIFPQAKKLPVHTALQTALKEHKRTELEVYFPPFDRWYDDIIYPTDGGVALLSRDITDKKQIEQKIAQERKRLEDIVANVPGVVWEAYGKPNAKKQRIDFVSKYVEKMLGYTTEEWVSKPNFWLTVVHPDDQKRAAAEARAIFEGGKGGISRFRWVTKNGTPIWVEAQSYVTLNEKGKPIGMRGVTLDISERMELERRKDEFIGIVSHELKTPVTSLKAFEQVLQKRFSTLGDEKSSLLLRKMDNQIDKLITLIGDLLDITRTETGKLQFHEDYFYFDELVTEIIEEIQRTTEQHKIILEGKTGKTIRADRERVGQVIVNFLTNAIKYSPKSTKVRVLTKASNSEVQLSVKDYGMGIPQETQPYLFNRFYRVNTKLHNTIPGIGLGLYISAEIIKRLGGKIWVESDGKNGAMFSFTLPLKKK